MANFVELDQNNTVLRVIVGPELSDEDAYNWVVESLGGRWIKEDPNPLDMVYPSPGSTLCEVHQSFACIPNCSIGDFLRFKRSNSEQYLSKHAFFMGKIFKTSPECYASEQIDMNLVRIVEDVISIFNGNNIVDIGSGVGVIGITLAENLNDVNVYLVDPDPLSLDLAFQNHGTLINVYNILGTADSADLSFLDNTVDLVISNPPSVPSSFVLDDNQILAIDGGEDGLDVIRQVVNRSKLLLKSGGELIFRTVYISPEDCIREVLDDSWGNIRVVSDFVRCIKI